MKPALRTLAQSPELARALSRVVAYMPHHPQCSPSQLAEVCAPASPVRVLCLIEDLGGRIAERVHVVQQPDGHLRREHRYTLLSEPYYP